MSLFYDPQKKKTQPWILAIFLIIPLILFAFVFIYSKSVVKKPVVIQEPEKDIFSQ